MGTYRITKYNPSWREKDGRYLREDWTSVSDIGRSFAGKVLTLKNYLTTEDAYIAAIRKAMRIAKVDRLRIKNFEDYGLREHIDSALVSLYKKTIAMLGEGIEVSGPLLDQVARLCLREFTWCRLEGKDSFYVHFGYDYYMYIGFKTETQERPEVPGLFSEEFLSPL